METLHTTESEVSAKGCAAVETSLYPINDPKTGKKTKSGESCKWTTELLRTLLVTPNSMGTNTDYPMTKSPLPKENLNMDHATS